MSQFITYITVVGWIEFKWVKVQSVVYMVIGHLGLMLGDLAGGLGENRLSAAQVNLVGHIGTV